MRIIKVATKVIDKKGNVSFHSEIGTLGKDIHLKSKANGEEYIILFHPPEAIQKDKRKEFIKIIHSIDKEQRKHHEISFVLCWEKHESVQHYHLNLAGLSKKFLEEGKCLTCKKYFEELDHGEIAKLEQNYYSLNKTREQIESSLKKKLLGHYIIFQENPC